jgi:hypothetical protein
MSLAKLRDQLWNLVRWDVQDKAWWSKCNAKVLHGVAQKCAEGIRVLGYSSNEPPPDRSETFYKEWIRDVTNPALDAIYHWQVPDCSMTKALAPYQDAARRIRDCAVALKDIQTDAPLVHPADLEG